MLQLNTRTVLYQEVRGPEVEESKQLCSVAECVCSTPSACPEGRFPFLQKINEQQV